MTTTNNANAATKVVTGKVRFSYAHVWEPASINGGDEKYSVSILIPKSDKKTLKAIGMIRLRCILQTKAAKNL